MPVQNLVQDPNRKRDLSLQRKVWVEEHHDHKIEEIVALAPNDGPFYVEVGNEFVADAAMRILKQN